MAHTPPLSVAVILIASIVAALLLVVCGGQPDGTSPFEAANPSPTGHANDGTDATPGGHAGDEGLVLRPQAEESVYAAARCSSDAPVREFNAVVVNVEISLNRFLDYDPLGRMYVLEEELSRVRAEEAQNRAARADQADPAVTIGLQGDAIQPRSSPKARGTACISDWSLSEVSAAKIITAVDVKKKWDV